MSKSEGSDVVRDRAAWDEAEWSRCDSRLRERALRASESGALDRIVRGARQVLRRYSSSFFLATRFLPGPKRDPVEIIYAAVRYPDEIVDSFPLAPAERLRRLDVWERQYEAALVQPSLRDALRAGIPCFAAAFAAVVRRHDIPKEHYRSFLAAMRRDASPSPFETLDDLIESYVYGSAIVVGYFLTHVYGASRAEDLPRALLCARRLAIALQLTNFLRDVREDRVRGRIYLPMDLLRAEGLDGAEPLDSARLAALVRVIRHLAGVAEEHYALASADLECFAADCRTAIRVCIDVYRRLNARIAANPGALDRRESVPALEKFRALPPSKYWRLPVAYLRR